MGDMRVSLPEGSKGPWTIEHYEVRENDPANFRLMLQGRGCTPGTYTVLKRDGAVWMSDTTAEQRDHSAAVWQIKRRGGRVLIMGLGIGMVVKAALDCENVEHVDVVEISRDLIDLVGPHYEGPRCTIHHADAYKIKWPPNTRWSVIWHDIWRDISEDNLLGMAKLARSYGRRCDWQGFWSKDLVLDMRRRERSRGYTWGL